VITESKNPDASSSAEGGWRRFVRSQTGLSPRRSDARLIQQVRRRAIQLELLEPGNDAVSRDSGTVRLDYVDEEYVSSLLNSEPRERTWRRYQIYFTIALFSLGAMGTIAAATKNSSGFWHIAAIAAGALVASITTINQALAPGTKAAAFGIGYAELRDEGWDYVNFLGPYKKYGPGQGGSATTTGKPLKNYREAYELFASRTRTIARRTRAQTQTHEVRTR
jgi:hypothetical protein